MNCDKCQVAMVCVEDFAGNMSKMQEGFWADWCPTCKYLHFGGAWADVPSIKAQTEPSDFEAREVVKKHREDPSYYLVDYICADCHSPRITFKQIKEWDVPTQSWQMNEDDEPYCAACGSTGGGYKVVKGVRA